MADSVDGLFAIDRQSGVVTVAMDMLDYEAFSSPRHHCRGERHVTGSRTAPFTIQITDVPEPLKPIAEIDLSPNRINYGASSGDAVGITARAIDPDRGGLVSYRLSEDASGLFAIGRRDGVVTLASGSYDPERDYLIEVTAESNDSTSSSAQFTVRADKPILIAREPETLVMNEGESRVITFSFAETALEPKAISAGANHSCAIIADNEAVCWGNNDDNQSAPPPQEEFIAVSAGAAHSCGITADNEAVCWGSNDDNRSAPPPQEEFIAISAGGDHSCGITADNKAVCWGNNDDNRSAPPQGEFIAVSAGAAHSCGITADNDPVCWGSDENGRSSPTPDRKLIAVSAGSFYSCGITLDNDPVCWGEGDAANAALPLPGIKLIAISADKADTCGITLDNEAICWGGAFGTSLQPPHPQGRKYIAVSVGDSYGCGITADNEAVCWGGGGDGQTMPPQIAPTSADSVTVTATIADADRGQIKLSDNGQAVIPAGETQATLVVSVSDDELREPQTERTIGLSSAGRVMLGRDELLVTVFADDQDAETIGDVDDADNAVAEHSRTGAGVGITAHAEDLAAYALTDDADGRFMIDDTGFVAVADGDKLNFEEASSHSITVRAGDANSGQTISFVINVKDVPEAVGFVADIDLSPNRISYGVRGNEAVGITARAIDPDRGSVVRYSLTDDAGGVFNIDSIDGVVSLDFNRYRGRLRPSHDYLIEVTARSRDGTSSAAQFTIRPNEPVLIAREPEALTLREGTSQAITFSLSGADLELKGISAGQSHSCGITPDNRAVCWGSDDDEQSSPPADKRFVAISAGQFSQLRHRRRRRGGLLGDGLLQRNQTAFRQKVQRHQRRRRPQLRHRRRRRGGLLGR